MPKILIKEVDNTSASGAGNYSNYTVLITGYRGRKYNSNDKIQPDANGVYEFSSDVDFLTTIGEAAVAKNDAEGNPVELHYGNRMAYHLLKLGYPIIYKVIDSVSDMLKDDFWTDFYDKASYDFRFISHGLCETCYNEETHSKLENAYLTALTDTERFNKIISDVNEKIEAVDDRPAAYEAEYKRVIAEKGVKATNGDYAGEGEGYTGFKDAAGLTYAYNEAVAKFQIPEGKTIEDAPEVIVAKTAFDTHNAEHLTITTFNAINERIANLAAYTIKEDGTMNNEGRGDCIALIEIDEDKYTDRTTDKRAEESVIEQISNMNGLVNGKQQGQYCALTVPSVWLKTGKEDPEKFPGAFYYLACFANSVGSGFREWYAAAGYTRGVSSYVVDHTSVKLGEIAINALEPRNQGESGPMFACNVIANFRGSYYLWGNRTAAQLATATDKNPDLTAKHFLNIRQLSTTIKKQLYVACRSFTFDPNSDTLWFNFVGAITPTLDAMKADQGIRDYKVLKVVEAKPQKATLKAKIRIIPIEAVEDFDIEISLEDSFGGVSVNAN